MVSLEFDRESICCILDQDSYKICSLFFDSNLAAHSLRFMLVTNASLGVDSWYIGSEFKILHYSCFLLPGWFQVWSSVASLWQSIVPPWYISMRLQRKLRHDGTFKVTIVSIPIRSCPPWQRIIGVVILWFFSWTDYHTTFFLVNDNNRTIPLLSIVDIIFYFIFYFHLLRHVNKYVITCSKFYKLQAKVL